MNLRKARAWLAIGCLRTCQKVVGAGVVPLFCYERYLARAITCLRQIIRDGECNCIHKF